MKCTHQNSVDGTKSENLQKQGNLGLWKFFLADLANFLKYWYLNYLYSIIETIQNHECSTI